MTFIRFLPKSGPQTLDAVLAQRKRESLRVATLLHACAGVYPEPVKETSER